MQLNLKNIDKSFGDLKVLKNIQMDINEGTFVSLLGASGSGKTTLLRLIAGLEQPDKGLIQFGERVFYDSDNKTNMSPGERNLGMVFQDFALWPHMNVFENVAYPLKVRGDTKNLENRIDKVLDDVQLKSHKDRPIQQLSGGQQQRVSLARALISETQLILMDEPLSALDAALREQMRVLIKRLVKEYNMTTVFVTHDQYEAMTISDKIALMSNGQIIQYDTPENLFYKPTDVRVAKFIGQGTHLVGTIQDDQFILQDKQVLYGDFRGLAGRYEWIVRPENIEINDSGKNSAIIQTGSFTGEKYEYATSLAGHIISFYSNKKLNEETKVNLRFNITKNNLFKMEE